MVWPRRPEGRLAGCQAGAARCANGRQQDGEFAAPLVGPIEQNWHRVMNRTAIGMIALVLLTASVGLWVADWQGAAQVQFRAACLRIALAVGALWFAYPQLQRLPGWLIGALLSLAVVVAVRPRLFPLAVVVGLMLLVLRPRKKARVSNMGSPRSGP